MCIECADEVLGDNQCEEALREGWITDHCSLCNKKEICPFYFMIFDLEIENVEVTIQLCFDCAEKNHKLYTVLTNLAEEQADNISNTCPIHMA